MMSSNAHNGIERLKGRDNYATWSFSVKTFLEHEELLECIEADIVKDAKKDSKAKTKIILLVDPSLYIHIEEATTANQVWENLKKAFEDSGLSRKVNLLRDLINTSLETSNGVEDYISKIMSAAHKLRNIKFHVDDEWLGTLMLAGLSDEYKPMIMGLESSGVKISADLIKTKLLQEVKDSSATSAFYTNSSKKLFRNSHQQQSKSKGPRCFNCNKYGHLGKNCWFKNKKDNHDNNKSNGFVAAFSALTSNDSAKWYLDSGAAMHMTMHREWLQDETVPPVRHVRIADDKMLHVESCGKVEICVPSINGSTSMIQMGYWAEAVGTAAYIVNRSPTRALSFITPEEMWTGTAPDLSHLRVFGCEAMVHIPKEQRRKLDAKSRKLIFVGYSACTKGYRFIDPQSRRVYMSRDVIFLEGTAKRNTVQSFASENNTVNEKSSSAPEKEKKNTLESEVKVQEVVENRTQLEDKSREKENILNEQNKVYLPLSQTETAPENNENESYNETTSSTHSELLYESTHEEDTNSDPNDETYVPSGSDVDTSPENKQRPSRRNEFYQPRSYICMNSESTMSYLDSDPLCHEEALNSDKKNEWLNAMNEEYQALLQNNTWNLVELPEGKKVIPCKWVFKTKRDENGNIQRYKARLVIKGFRQTKGVDYHEVYAPVVRYSSVRYLLGVAAKYNLRIHQMDTVTAFLQGDVEEEIFMCQPPNYEEGHMVCKLNKSLYGLKQASRQWNKKLNEALLQIGLTRSKVDPCIYYRIVNDKNILFITVYVDDLMYFFNDEETASVVKLKLKEKFLMKDMGEVKQCMGYKIKQCGDEIHVSQTIYIEKILERFVMSDCNAVSTPCDPSVNLKKAESEEEILRNIPYQEAIGCLLYLSQGTRPDITYIVNTLSKFNNQPTAQHWAALKRVFRYLKGTKDLQLVFKCDAGNIVGYCDADWASNTDDRRSCTGYMFLFQGAAISWSSKRQPTVALSSTEAEYMALSSAIQEAMWLKQLQEDFWPSLSNDSFDVYCDNQSALSIAGHDVYHARSKHIDVRYHFIREKIEAKQISLKYQCSEDMVADALTKGLQRLKHDRHLSTMGLRSGEGVEVNAANTE
ncbi:uncharacterized protein LOC119691901 isoform X3 [Plutella xylostella]|uniref:uncharacterized protein LOC119691901 isoform X3 n=1 Tax=Plutella xylostella TaxID=51655 RepID=UPI002032BE2D|nr:uncharacterized protein LOC119691901 isoform X3 [Plutella xylostella]